MEPTKNVAATNPGGALVKENRLTGQGEGLIEKIAGLAREKWQLAPQRNGRSASPKEDEIAAKHGASAMNPIRIIRPKLSGAQKRKQAIQAAIAAGEPIRPRRQRTNRGRKKCESGMDVKLRTATPAQKRLRPEGSTLFATVNKPLNFQKSVSGESVTVKPTTSSQGSAGGTFSQPLTTVKMAIVLDKYPEERLSEMQSKKIQMAVMEEIWKCEPGAAPQFRNSYVEKGVAYFTCGNDKSRIWLIQAMSKIDVGKGFVLRIGSARDIVKTTKVITWIPKQFLGTTTTEQIFKLLETQNIGLTTKEWHVISSKEESKGTTYVLNIDEYSLKVLNGMGFKPYLGLTQLTFKVV